MFSRYLNVHPTCLFVPEPNYVDDIPAFEVEELSDEEEEKIKPKGLQKVKQIRKRNKVGLRYLEVDQNAKI